MFFQSSYYASLLSNITLNPTTSPSYTSAINLFPAVSHGTLSQWYTRFTKSVFCIFIMHCTTSVNLFTCSATLHSILFTPIPIQCLYTFHNSLLILIIHMLSEKQLSCTHPCLMWLISWPCFQGKGQDCLTNPKSSLYLYSFISKTWICWLLSTFLSLPPLLLLSFFHTQNAQTFVAI